jgi:hypothetical protein
MIDTDSSPPPLKKNEIFSKHGCLVVGLWWLSYLLTFISIHYNLSRLARRFDGTCSPYDHEEQKAKPWWQDIELLIALILTLVALFLVFLGKGLAYSVGMILSLIVMLDLLNFHARALWFDDLLPPISESATAVWSHRRLLFHAAISFVASVFLFSGFYTLGDKYSDKPFKELVGKSFRTATTLYLGKEYGLIEAIQIAVSIFFLVVVIATVASSAYKRKELADRHKDSAA